MQIGQAKGLEIDLVTVDDPGNVENPLQPGSGSPAGGSVPYIFEIGRTEVTVGQYVEFLNSVDPNGSNFNRILENSGDQIVLDSEAPRSEKYTAISVEANKPLKFTTWYRAARFVNWLENGQPTFGGGTEIGTYDLTHETAYFARLPGARWALPSYDEWYKAAYYSPIKESGLPGYWLYGTQSDVVPTASQCDPEGNVTNRGTNVATYDPTGSGGGCAWNGEAVNVSTVGDTGSASFWGTLDQMGNVSEWTDTGGGGKMVSMDTNFSWGASTGSSIGRVQVRDVRNGNSSGYQWGFRVVRLPVPEPSTTAATLAAIATLSVLARRGEARGQW